MRKYERIAYEVDPHNRLVLKSGRKSQVKRYRACLDGTFKTDKNNSLTYHVKKPSPIFMDRKLPQNIKLKGNWSLTKTHNLVYTLDKWQNQIYGNRLILKGGPADAKGNSLLFILTAKEGKMCKTYAVGLSGTWRANKFNRLSFLVKKEGGFSAPLIFGSKWKVNKDNQIIYEYKKGGKTRRIAFRGSWDITGKHKILYTLDKHTGSGFEFRVGPGVYEKGLGLKYHVGIGLSRMKRPKMNVIALLGKWKVSKKVGLIYEMGCGRGKIQHITFGASLKFNKQNAIEIELKGKKGHKLGIKFTLSSIFRKNQMKTYLTFLKNKGEISVGVGMGFLF